MIYPKPRTKAELWSDLKAKFDEEREIMLMRMGNCPKEAKGKRNPSKEEAEKAEEKRKEHRQFLLCLKILWNNRKKTELGIKQRVTSYANEIGLPGGAQKYFTETQADPRWKYFQVLLRAAYVRDPRGKKIKSKTNRNYRSTHPKKPRTPEQKVLHAQQERARYQLKKDRAQEDRLMALVLEQV